MDNPCVIFAAVSECIRCLVSLNTYLQIVDTRRRGKNILFTHLLVCETGSFFIFDNSPLWNLLKLYHLHDLDIFAVLTIEIFVNFR